MKFVDDDDDDDCRRQFEFVVRVEAAEMPTDRPQYRRGSTDVVRQQRVQIRWTRSRAYLIHQSCDFKLDSLGDRPVVWPIST